MHLWDLFDRSWRRSPGNTAVVAPGGSSTYEQLGSLALRTSAALRGTPVTGPFIGLCMHRDVPAYAAMLGILHAGGAYVPLDPKQPLDRLITIARSAGLMMILCDAGSREVAQRIAQAINARTIDLLSLEEMQGPSSATPAMGNKDGFCYMLFTSGSTGQPKGVPIRHRNVSAYLDHVSALLGPTNDDRFSQTFELTFDLSVHDIFLCWSAGATLVVPKPEDLLAPARYIRDHALTFWFSTPSTAVLLDRFRLLRPGSFPGLRASLFCGEPLSSALALKWCDAAPHSRVLNFYGPTEATVAITGYEVERGKEPKSHNGILCIGRPFTKATCTVDSGPGEENEGELLLGGPQVTDGYWNDPDRSAKAFVQAQDGPWTYRTGDRVSRDADGDLFFLSRIDDQVKIRGHRVELQEVNNVLKEVSGAAFAHSLAHPMRDGVAAGLVAFLPETLKSERDGILKACAARLPDYMVPAAIHFIKEVPLNASGKTDLKALRAYLP